MKTRLLLTALLLVIAANTYGQQTPWAKWAWLIGAWKGEGAGQPGKGGGTFSFTKDLNEKILVRKGHSEYPATSDKPTIVHDDLLIVYPDFSGNPSKAIYFDNEGHTINYSISYTDKNIVLLSDKIPNAPLFRLTYTSLDNETIDTKFEMSQDGEKFIPYIEGKSKRIK